MVSDIQIEDLQLLHDLLYPAHLAVLQHYLYAVWMEGRAGEDRLHNSTHSFSCALVLLENDVHLQAGANVFAILSIFCGWHLISDSLRSLYQGSGS